MVHPPPDSDVDCTASSSPTVAGIHGRAAGVYPPPSPAVADDVGVGALVSVTVDVGESGESLCEHADNPTTNSTSDTTDRRTEHAPSRQDAPTTQDEVAATVHQRRTTT